MSYRRYDYFSTHPSAGYYSSILPTNRYRREFTTTSTERHYGGPVVDYNYSYETTTKRSRPSYAYGYSPSWYPIPDNTYTTTTTRIGPYGVTSRTYRY